jgi:hypothetical protein
LHWLDVAFDDFDAARRTFRQPAAAMQNINSGIFDGEYEFAVLGGIERCLAWCKAIVSLSMCGSRAA